MSAVELRVERRAKIEALEKAMLEHGERAEIQEKHHFAHGTYTREIFIPAGTALVGKIHRNSCINIISQGRIKVITDEGEYEISAPYTFVSGPGVKKAGYALEDTVWLNVHPWAGEQNLELIEQEMIIPATNPLIEQGEAWLG